MNQTEKASVGQGSSPDDRVSARSVVSADIVERYGGSLGDILTQLAVDVRRQVKAHNAGKQIESAAYYITYEEIVAPDPAVAG